MMKNKFNTKSLLAASLLMLSGNALAAGDAIILNAVSGEVLVNQGESYAVPSKNMPVAPGDQVMVTEGGLAKLSYPNGCVLDITGAHILNVSATSPCVAGALTASVGGAAAAGGVTAASGSAAAGGAAAGGAAAAGGVSAGVVVASLAGVAAMAVVLSDNNEKNISR